MLIANRGEIAVRIARAPSDMKIATVAVFSQDNALSLHTRRTDAARALSGIGPVAYLDAGRSSPWHAMPAATPSILATAS